MKKFLGIVVLSFMFFTPTFSQIIEFGKCYSLNDFNPENIKRKWNNQHYKILNKVYIKFTNPQQNNYGDNLWSVMSYETVDSDYLEYRNDLISDGYTEISRLDKNVISINLNNNLITTVREISAERLKSMQKRYDLLLKVKKNNPNKWSSYDQVNLERIGKQKGKYRYINEFKIVTYAAGLIKARRLDQLEFDNGWSVQVDIDNQTYKLGPYKELNNTTGNYLYACTDQFKSIIDDKKSTKIAAPKKTGSLLKLILKFVN